MRAMQKISLCYNLQVPLSLHTLLDVENVGLALGDGPLCALHDGERVDEAALEAVQADPGDHRCVVCER